MNKGDLISPKSFPAIQLEQLKAYGKAASDPNPIHWDEAIARKAGLPSCIAHGMLIAAYVANRAEEFAPGWNLRGLKTRFLGMTLLNDVVSVSGKVAVASGSELVLDLVAKNQKGDLLISGEARFSR